MLLRIVRRPVLLVEQSVSHAGVGLVETDNVAARRGNLTVAGLSSFFAALSSFVAGLIFFLVVLLFLPSLRKGE